MTEDKIYGLEPDWENPVEDPGDEPNKFDPMDSYDAKLHERMKAHLHGFEEGKREGLRIVKNDEPLHIGSPDDTDQA